jgi:hypothetical protein
MTAPALLYLLHHPLLRAVKVGITGNSERVRRFQQRGWTLQHNLTLTTGAAAWTLERAVLTRIRVGLGLSHYLTPQQMRGVGGFTETFDESRLGVEHLRSIIDAEEQRLDLTHSKAQ